MMCTRRLDRRSRVCTSGVDWEEPKKRPLQTVAVRNRTLANGITVRRLTRQPTTNSCCGGVGEERNDRRLRFDPFYTKLFPWRLAFWRGSLGVANAVSRSGPQNNIGFSLRCHKRGRPAFVLEAQGIQTGSIISLFCNWYRMLIREISLPLSLFLSLSLSLSHTHTRARA